jgi:DNA-binding winged helix-turn-helix (wHTH) protein
MRLKFGSWEVDTDRRLLTHGGAPASLSPKAFDLLVVLAQHHEKAFSKAELHRILWPDTFVSDGSLTILVAEIRDVLNDDAEQPQFIRTVRRFGYGFCAPVTAQDASPLPSLSGGGGWVIWGNRSIAIGRTECVLGRSLDADIRFDVPGVSRRHARIVVDSTERRIWLDDLASKNGTRLRGVLVRERVELSDGDELEFGVVRVKLRSWSSTTGAETKRIARRKPQ